MDSIVVDFDHLDKESVLSLFVLRCPGTVLDDMLQAKLNNASRRLAFAQTTKEHVHGALGTVQHGPGFGHERVSFDKDAAL